MDYYRSSTTQQSWRFLVDLKRRFQFVLIGGWAVWLYTKQLKSKDIDLVVELQELERLKSTYDIVKNDRLKKYEFRSGEVAVHVYTPFYSSPGVPAQDILKDARVVEGFHVPSRELLLVLKSVAWASRRSSAKGRKDLLDIMALLESGRIKPGVLRSAFHTAPVLEQIRRILVNELQAVVSVPELALSVHQIARSKKRWREVLQ